MTRSRRAVPDPVFALADGLVVRPTARRLAWLALAAVLSLAPAMACSARERPANQEVMGAYLLGDGRLVSIRRSEGETLRARFYESGESRRLYPRGKLRFVAGPGFAGESPVEIEVEFRRGTNGAIDGLTWRPVGAAALSGRRVNRSLAVGFESDGARLSGRLDLPTQPGPHSRAVVLLHGSGSSVATEYFYNGDFLAAHGTATLTYDKRGTGASEGEVTFDFDQLARDAVAAVAYLSRLPELEGTRIGLSGYSQGAWIAPLAASMSERVHFVVASYGLVASPAEEARVETRNLLRSRGVREEDLDDVDELTLASVAVVASGFESGWDELARLEREYRRAPWKRELRGTTVGRFVRYPRWLIRLVGPRQSPPGLPWYHDGDEILERLDIPMVWLLAEDDTSAPLELSLPFLERLQAQGKPITIRVFPGADHAMLLYADEGGERVPTGYAPGYFRAEVEAAASAALGATLPTTREPDHGPSRLTEAL